jgi:hypothetical protein
VLNVHGVCDVRQMDIHMAEPLVPEPSLVKVKTAIEKLKRYIYPQKHRLLFSVWNKEELPQQWK